MNPIIKIINREFVKSLLVFDLLIMTPRGVTSIVRTATNGAVRTKGLEGIIKITHASQRRKSRCF